MLDEKHRSSNPYAYVLRCRDCGVPDGGEKANTVDRLFLAPSPEDPPDRPAQDRPVLRPGRSDRPDGATLTTAIVSLACNLRLEVVAEVMETEEQMACLRVLGCDLAQGFLLSRLLPADELP
jgi:hypothetical protein